MGVRPLPSLFCPLLKISLGNSYPKILDLEKLFFADAYMQKKKTKKLVSPPPWKQPMDEMVNPTIIHYIDIHLEM